MPQYIKKIRTSSGDLKIDYEALANLPKLGALAPKNKVGKDDLANDALDGYATIDTIVGPHSQELSYNLKSNNEYDVAGIGSCTDTDIIIPSIVDGKRVTGIDSSAFSQCTSLKSIIIPDSVTNISHFAFYNCAALTSITIPDSVTSIGNAAFAECTSLTSIILPDSVTSIGDYAFRDCTSLRSIIIPNSVTSISRGAFSDCPYLTIYCEVESQPEGWDTNWNPDNRPVVWGAALDFASVNNKLANTQDVDLTDYATKQYVDDAVENVSVEVDASLTEKGKAADSYAVGEAFMKLFNETIIEGESVGETITWDGKIDGRMFTEKETTISGEGSIVATYVHVSDNVPTYDQLVNGFTYKWVYSEDDRTQVNTQTYVPDTIELEETDDCIKINYRTGELILGNPIFVKRPFVNSTGHVFNLPGIYFYVVSARVITDSTHTSISYTTSLTIPGYNFTTSNRTISKLKNEYLPNEVETLINKVDATADIYLAMPSAIEGLGGVHTLDEAVSATLGATITSNVYVVKSLPTQLKPSFNGDYVMNVYVVDDTGIGYVSMSGLVMSLSDVLEESLGQSEFTGAYNKGWTSDINAVNAETAPGIYCVRGHELFDTVSQYIGDTLTVPDTLDESKLIKILDIPDTTPPAAYYALKLSDSVPTIDDINRGWSGTGTGGQYPTGSLTHISDNETYISISDGYEASYGIYIIKEPNVTIVPNGSPISEPGVYAPVLSVDDALGCGVKTFTIPGYNFLSAGKKTIKSEFIPFDETLSVAGRVADAKAVGDALSAFAGVNEKLAKIPTPTPADAGKFLMVDENGNYVLKTIPSLDGVMI